MSGLIAVGYFLTNLFFSFLIFVLWVRVALRYFHVSTLHPISKAIYSFTDPFVSPLEKLLPHRKTNLPSLDWPSIAGLVFAEIVKFTLLALLVYHGFIPFFYLMALVIADLIIKSCNFLFYFVLLRVIMSWTNPLWRHPALDIVTIVTEPLFRLARRWIPGVAGFDLSPLVILILLEVLVLFVSVSVPMRF